jgi:ABC-type antimicrobial peptide transport system permease subunit
MPGHVLWLALTNIKRKKFGSITFFVTAFLIAQSIFLLNLSKSFLRLSDLTGITEFFSLLILSTLLLGVLFLCGFSLLLLNFRRQEIGILRTFGARKIDIIVLISTEVFLLSIFGALAGHLFIILLIVFDFIYLPTFIQGMGNVELIKLIGIGGQTIFLVALIEVAVSMVLLSIYLRHDVKNLTRGSP